MYPRAYCSFLKLTPQDKYTICFLFCNYLCCFTVFGTRCVLFRFSSHVGIDWRSLWRSAIRGNLKIVLTDIKCGTARVPVWRWGAFWWFSRVRLLFPDVLWEFQKPDQSQRGGDNDNLACCCDGKDWQSVSSKKGQKPEEEFLTALLFDDVELVVVPQSTGHFLVCHIVSVLRKRDHTPSGTCMSPYINIWVTDESHRTTVCTHLVVSPETCQSIGVDHPENQAVLVFPSYILLVAVVTQQLIHIVPQQSTLWQMIKNTTWSRIKDIAKSKL